jgi:hypothetical protein
MGIPLAELNDPSAALAMPAALMAFGPRPCQGRVGVEGARIVNWYVRVVGELAARGADIRDALARADLTFTVKGQDLPAALLLVFDVDSEQADELLMFQGAAVYEALNFTVSTPSPRAGDPATEPQSLSAEAVEGWLDNAAGLNAELRAPFEDKPFVAFVFFWGRLRIVHSAGIPLDHEGLPDRRIIRFQPSKWEGWGQKPIAPHPVRSGGIAEAPNGPVFQTLRRAGSRPEKWQADSDQGQYFYAEDERAVIYQPFRPADQYGEDWWSECRDHVMRALAKRFGSIKHDLVADVMDVLFLHWLRNARPAKAAITLSEICEYRQVLPTRDALASVWSAVQDIRGMQLRDAVFQAQVFDIDSAALPFQPNLWRSEEPPRADVVYVYSPGYFVGAALNGDAGDFLASYSPRLLHLDPYRDRDAKRIGRYLRAEWRMNPGGYLPDAPWRHRSWKDHLEEAGITPSQRERTHVSEFKESIYHTLARLSDAGGIATPPKGLSMDEWVEAVLTHPGCRGSLPRYGKLEAFLSRTVHLPPALDLVPGLANLAAKRLARAAQHQALATGGKQHKRAQRQRGGRNWSRL